MRIFRIIPGWVSLFAAACLFTSAIALAAPEEGKTEAGQAAAGQADPAKTEAGESDTKNTENGKPGAGKPGAPSELNADKVEYNMKTGQMTAEGNVVIRYDGGVATGAFATFNTKTYKGEMTGGVVADKDDMHLDCDRVEILSKTQMVAIGDVHGWKADKRVDGPRVEYDDGEGYARLPEGGMLSSADGTFTADYIEGWSKTERAKGVGNAHIVSPPKNFEGGADEAEYFGKENGKIVLTGNAWAIQDNNTLKSGRLTVFLQEQGKKTETVANDKGQEQQ